ncbi:hypothetical protein FNF28_04399 [Cafeteria roenbergensis]|uniref:Uncharacterized protein n=1 Tax=Cafeteria roenbergensis TaxID=33653 RepID=A0A5A8DEX4_CAFRO|nr:hypothetical protein FNF28_04399 [Cafeteria roenbergensis]
MASDDDRFDWGFLSDMRASIRQSQTGALPGAALVALQQAKSKAIARLVVAFEALTEKRRDVWGERALLQLERLWAEAKVSERDRQVFRSAHCEPPMTASKAVAVAQHLSLLSQHCASLESVKAAARARERGVAMLRKVLTDALDGWPSRATGPAAQASRVDEWALAGSQGSIPGSEAGKFERSSSGGSEQDEDSQGLLQEAPRASRAAEAVAARSELAGGKWRARGVEHSSLAALKAGSEAAAAPTFAAAGELSVEERRFAIKHRVRVRALMLHTLRHTLAACEGIVRWRSTMWRPHAFLWRGKNLLRTVRKDLEFLARDPAASVLARLHVPQDELDVLLAFWRPPSLRPEGAAPSASAPAGTDFGSVLGLCNRGLLPPDLRLVARVDRALAVVHSEQGLQKRLARETELLESKGLFVPVLRWRLAEPHTEPSDADAVQAALRDTLCGKGASADCQVVLTCDFGLSSGAVLGIVVGVVVAFCLIVGAGVWCARCEAEDDDFTDADSMFRGGRRDSDESHGARGFRFPSFAIMAAKQGSDEDCIEGMAGRVGAKGFATATTARRGSDGTESWIACSDHSLTTCSRDAASARDNFLLTAEGRGLRAHGDDGL